MSDSGNAISGFATAMDGLATELGKQGHEVFYLGWQFYGQPAKLDTHPHYTLLPNFGGQSFAQASLPTHLMHVHPDVIVALGDFFMTGYVISMPRLVPYCHWYPIDGSPIPTDIIDMLKGTDMKVCFSKFGFEESQKAGVLNTNYIPHGVRHDIYTPKPAETKLLNRQALGRHYGIPDMEKKFIVGQVNRNQRRKMFDRWIQAMAKACAKDPDIIGLLHCDYNEPRESGGWNIPYLLMRYGLEKRVFQTPNYVNFMYGATADQMSSLYNVFDVHFSATGGEGFGLSTVESQASGVPNIITDYTTSKELVADHGILVKPETYTICDAGVDRALIDIDEAAEGILRLKNDPKLREEYSLKGREHMIRDYDWTNIGKAFSEFLTLNVN